MTASFIEYFTQPQSTPLPMLGIDSDLYQLQLQSKDFFTIEPGASAADGNQLAIFVKVPFQLKLPNTSPQNTRLSLFPAPVRNDTELAVQSKFIQDCISLFKLKSQKLRQIDNQIVSAVLLAVAAMSIPFLPFAGWIAMTAWISAIYLTHQRGNAYTEYHEALVLLVATCNWTLGDNIRSNNVTDLTKANIIQEMMAQLYPVLTEAQTKHFIADDIELSFIDALKRYDSSLFSNSDMMDQARIPELEQLALKKRGAEFIRCVYGLNKGKPQDFLDALLMALPDLWRAAKNTAQYYMTPAPSQSM